MKDSYIALICGSRNWTDELKIQSWLVANNPTAIITGDCRGADRIAFKIASRLGIDNIVYRARWDLYGKAAGPKRNLEMLAFPPDIVVAFHPNLQESKGTSHCLSAARKLKIKTVLIT